MNQNQLNMLELLKEIQLEWPHFGITDVVYTMINKIGDYYDEMTNDEELEVYKAFIEWQTSKER